MKKLALLIFAAITTLNVFAAYLRNVPVDLKQPDGTVIHCFITGDEFHRRLHDKDNYTIVLNPSIGYYVYAILRGDDLMPTSYIVGTVDPMTLSISPGYDIPASQIEGKIATVLKSAKTIAENPTKGDFNNLVISIRFSDQSPTNLSVSDYENKFNSTSGLSLKSYYKEVSNSQLNITSYFFPKPQDQTILEYQDSHPRAYYSIYDANTNPIGYLNDAMDREQTLLKNAVEFVKNQIAESQINIDINNDGLVDNLVFVMQGNTDNWGNILWPMTNSLSSQVFIGSKQVQQYNKQLSTWLNADVISHEFFHTLGAPDLYHYTNKKIDPVGSWDIMGNTGAQHMTTYMKWKYGKWFDAIPEISQPGTYTLKPVSQSPFACYKIPSPVSSAEYFILEYRKKEGYLEGNIPANYTEGLIIYRINTQVPWGNAGGPPDELYIYRPRGDNISNGDIYQAAFSSNTLTKFNEETSPSCFLSNGEPGEIDISNVTSAGNEISFTVNAVNPLPKPGNLKATAQNSQVLLSWNSPLKKGFTLLGYNVFLEGNNSPLNTSLITDTTYLTPNPGLETIYTYKLTAKFQQGESNPVTCVFLNATNPSVLDSLSLVVLYSQCDGSNWLHNDNWLKGPMSTWYGVAMENKRVVGLEFLPPTNLIRSGLKNSLPREIGNLTELRRLRLYNSDFTGPIPREIGNLKKLEFLELGQNKFSGNIPKEIGNLTNLTDLWMQNNLLEGPLPVELSNLTNLTNLILGINRFTGEIPSWIGNFPEMNNLNLSQNLFTGTIPPEIGKLSKLEYLALNGYLVGNYKMFHGEIPKQIFNLKNLKVLALFNNSLTGNIPPEIGNLKNLVSLNIWGNELSGSIPKEINSLSNLTFLDIGFNQLKGTIPNIGNLKKLEWLSFHFNQLVGSVPSDIRFMTNLNFLYFRGNKLNNIPDFSGLLRLMDLSIEENNFTFEDIEPIAKIHFRDKWCSGLTYSPQARIGKTETITAPINQPYDLSVYCGGKNNRYQWFKNGQVLSEIQISPEFAINSVVFGNNGEFVCRVTNTIVPYLTIESYPITLIGANTLIANAGNDCGVNEGSLVTLDVTGSYNPNGTPLTYKWTAPAGISLSATNVSNPTFTAPEVEYETAFEVTLVVYDGLLNSSLDKVSITVKPKSNYNKPIAEAGYNQTVNAGDLVTLNGSYSYDPNGNALTYLWTAPDGISISSTTDVYPKFTMPSIEGKKHFVFTLVVSDGILESEPDQVVISTFMNNCPIDANNDVIPNDYPYEPKYAQSITSIRSGSLEKIMLAVGHEDDFPFIILRKWVSDQYENVSDGEVIAISEKGSNRPTPINTKEMSTFIFKVQPYLISGEKYVLEVANGRPFLVNPGIYPAGHYYESTNLGYERDMRFALYVCKGENNPPIASAGADQTINEGATVILNGSNSSDTDGDTLSFKWTAPGGTMLSTTEPKLAYTTPEVKRDSTIRFLLVVSDGVANSLPDTVNVNVLNVIKVGVIAFETTAFQIYPNPSTGIVNYKIGNAIEKNAQIAVYNGIGEKVWEQRNLKEIKGVIDLSRQVSGIYFIQYNSASEAKTAKIVLKRD